MRVIHRIGINADDFQKKVLQDIGIAIPNGFCAFELEENTEQYSKLKPYIEKWQLLDILNTQFTNEELDTAPLLAYNFTWSNGYPQPEDNFGYIGVTYKKEGYCKNCGTGLVQQSPFRLQKEPTWGTKKIFELNWVFDEIFVRRDTYEQLFKPYGIQSMPVLHYKKESVLENTVQLVLPGANLKLNLEKQPFESCKMCGTPKYNPQIKGFFPSLEEPIPAMPIFKSLEYFGSGASAYKRIFIAQELRQEMLKHKIKSQFIPVEKLA